MKKPTDLYIEKVKEQLVCDRRHKAAILQQLSADVEAYAHTLGDDCSIHALEAEFGTPEHAAEAALHFEGVTSVRDKVHTKRAFLYIVAATCIIALLAFLTYIAYDNDRKEKFVNGYEVVTIYEHNVEGTPPPEPEGTYIYID